MDPPTKKSGTPADSAVTADAIKSVVQAGKRRPYLTLSPFLAKDIQTNGWVVRVVQAAIGQIRNEANATGNKPESNNTNAIVPANTSDEAIKNAANAVLSVLRALGTAEVVLNRAGERAKELCSEQNPCLVEPYGSVLSAKKDPAHRAVGVAVTSGHDVPRCVGLAPPGNIHLLPTEGQP